MHTYQVVEAQNPDSSSGFWGGIHTFRVAPQIGEHLIWDEAHERHLYEVVHVIHRISDEDNLPVLIVKTIAWPDLIRAVEFV